MFSYFFTEALCLITNLLSFNVLAAAPQTSSASSFQDIANLLASALQGKPTPTPDTPASTGDETDVQTTTQNIIQVSFNLGFYPFPFNLYFLKLVF